MTPDFASELEDLNRRIAENPADAQALYRRGALLWRMGQHARALSDYNRSAALDPLGPGAAAALHAREIFNFFNPDLYNP